MTQRERVNCLFHGVEGFLGVVAGLLLVSLGLWAYGVQILDSTNLPSTLGTLFLASWIGVVGLAGVALIPLWLLVRAGTTCR